MKEVNRHVIWMKVGSKAGEYTKNTAYSNSLTTGLKNSFENRRDNYTYQQCQILCEDALWIIETKEKKKKYKLYYEKNPSKFELFSKMIEKIEEHSIGYNRQCSVYY